MPWKEGYWYTKGSTSWVMIVKGDTSETKNIVALDYPDAKSMGSSKWTYAKTPEEYGLAEEEIFNASGVEFYNLRIEYDMGGPTPFVMHGVLNDDGNKLYMRGIYRLNG
jgi:hypothetical protein